MIAENTKLKDACESVLYSEARAKMDAECAAAGDECRIALEAVADILGERVKNDSEACRKVLDGNKTLTGAYGKMKDTVEKRVKLERGKIVCGAMDDREARTIILAYYDIHEQQPTEKTPASSSGIKSIFDFM